MTGEGKHRGALGSGWLDTDAAQKPVEEGTAGRGRHAAVTVPEWGQYVNEQDYEAEKFAYETAVSRAGVITTETTVELPPAVIDLNVPTDAESVQPSA